MFIFNTFHDSSITHAPLYYRLIYAAFGGYLEVAELLIKSGANLDKQVCVSCVMTLEMNNRYIWPSLEKV